MAATAPSEPTTAHGAADGRNLHGRMMALTFITPISLRRDIWLKVLMWHARHFKMIKKHIVKFPFMYFLRWAIIHDLPYNGPPQEKEKLRYRYLFFQADFDGPWEEYVDAFAYVIPMDLKVVWGVGPAYPAPPPATTLRKYIARNNFANGHFYCGYPDCSAGTVLSVVDLKRRFEPFAKRAPSLTPEAFQREWLEFVTAMQKNL